MKKYLQSVVIMRGQVLTTGHCELIKTAIANGEETLIVLGSYNTPSMVKNPFTCLEREMMIRKWLKSQLLEDYISFIYLEDYQDDDDWIMNLGKIMFKHQHVNHIRPDDRAFYTSSKDDDSELRNAWAKGLGVVVNVVPTVVKGKTLNATTARNYLLSAKPDLESKEKALTKLEKDGLIHHTIKKALLDWFVKNDFGENLYHEYNECVNYESKYGKGSAHLTSDALVVVKRTLPTHAGDFTYPEYMLIKRGGKVGKNLLAMAGGFVDNNESFEDAAIRELKEETGLTLSRHNITNRVIADSPNRDPRGRIISIVHIFEVHAWDLKNLKAGDDASEIVFKTFNNIKKCELFSDHYDTIKMYHETIKNN